METTTPVKKTKKDKAFSLRDVMTKMGGVNVRVVAKDDESAKERRKIKFPCFILNMIMGGGIPEGKFIEIFGKKSTAKSTLAMLLANDVAEKGGYVLVLDKDADSWDYPNRNIQLGLDPSKVDHVMMTQPTTIEEVFDTIENFIKNVVVNNEIRNVPVLVIWDSIAGTTSAAELKAKLGEKNFKDHAKLITEGHRRLEALMTDNLLKNVVFLWINQARNPMVQGYGYQEPVTFGGDAPSFFSAIRLELTRTKQLACVQGKTTYPVGIIVKVHTIKNKVFSPLQACKVRLLFTRGIDDAGTTYDWIEANGLIKRSTKNEIEAGNLPLKIMLDDGYMYIDKGKAFKDIYASEQGDKLRAFIEKYYANTLETFTSAMAGESDIVEQAVEEEEATTPAQAMGVKAVDTGFNDEISLEG